MPGPRGFATGDFDPAFELDERFMSMRRSVDPATYHAATGVYYHLMGATWRKAARVNVALHVPDAPPEAIAALRAAGLIDSRGMVRRPAFDRWVGAAIARRRKETDRKTRQRDPSNSSVQHRAQVDSPRSLSRGTDGDSGRQESTLIPEWTTNHGSVRQPEAARDALVAVVAYIEATTGRPFQHRPGSRIWDTLEPDVRDFGSARVIDAMSVTAAAVEHPDIGQLVFGASSTLHPLVRAATTKPETPQERQLREITERQEARQAARQNGGTR